jgi:hypothetical protein
VARRYIAWGRVTLVAALFGVTLAAILWTWRVRPPVTGLTGTDSYGRNVPGDLSAAVGLLVVEFLIALAALQPWTPWPHRRWIGLAGLLFGAWGVLRFLVGLHAAPVMLPHDLLMLVLGLVLCGAVLAFPRRGHDAKSSGAAT